MVGLKAHWHTWSVIAPYLMDRVGKRTSFSEEFVACSHAETISENDLAQSGHDATTYKVVPPAGQLSWLSSAGEC